MDADETADPPVWRIKKRHIFGAVFLLLLILVAIAWWQRIGIADRVIADQLQKAGVRARYQIDEVGLRTQRLTNVVVGDPANPDLTARLVEVDLKIGFGTPAIRSVWAEGVRLKGRYVDGKLLLGELDKFRDLNSKEPFAIPDLNIALRDSSVALTTPWGGVGLAIEGQGHLQRSFTGKAAVRAPVIAGEGCEATGLRFDGAVSIRSRQPIIDGPIAAAALRCPAMALAVTAPMVNGEFRLNEKFDRWLGDSRFAIGAVRYGARQLSAPSGKLSFDGGKARTNFTFALNQGGYAGDGLRLKKLAGDARGTLAFGDDGIAVSAIGGTAITGGSAPTHWLSGLSAISKSTAATPVGPVLAQLDPAIQGVLRSFAASANFDAAFGGGQAPNIAVSGLHLTSASGAQLRQVSRNTIRRGQLTGAIKVALKGGGLPTGTVTIAPQGRGWAGTLALDTYAAKGGSLWLPQLAFNGGPDGNWRFNGKATLSGPLIGGRIEGLSLPVEGSYGGGRFTMLPGCRDVRFQSFGTGAFHLPGQSFRACADGAAILQAGAGGTRFALTSPALSGTAKLGSTPVHYAGSRVRFSLDRGFVAEKVSVDLGQGDSMTRLTMDAIDGSFAGPGLGGAVRNATATIGTVPLLAENANGRWSYIRNVLALDAALTISDAEQVDRFNTLQMPDLNFTLENGQIAAFGNLVEPKSAVQFAGVDVKHDLGSGAGRALLALDGLRFDDKFSLDALTPLALGAVANVVGDVTGDGRIEWDKDGVRSFGKFETKSLDFAAAFGPVEGLSTEINFTDLLGIETAPSQIARIKSVNPGIPAFDGEIRYRLLAGRRVEIEAGHWPFYGGELILEPTVLDLDVAAQRRLTFRLVGLDAQKFLAGYDIENLSVSGIFDGTLPMVFDADGGRIVGGSLVSRAGGGELSYLGPLSYEDMGTFTNFAFNALRSIRFEEMRIGVAGNLGGEIVTEVNFRGLQQGSAAKRNFLTKQIAKIPMEFNVRISAEFLTLIGNLRTLYDGEYAAQRFKAYAEEQPPVTGEEGSTP